MNRKEKLTDLYLKLATDQAHADLAAQMVAPAKQIVNLLKNRAEQLVEQPYLSKPAFYSPNSDSWGSW